MHLYCTLHCTQKREIINISKIEQIMRALRNTRKESTSFAPTTSLKYLIFTKLDLQSNGCTNIVILIF